MADTNIIKMGKGRMEERIATLREARTHLITGGCHNDPLFGAPVMG
jgi:hypothetical protein